MKVRPLLHCLWGTFIGDRPTACRASKTARTHWSLPTRIRQLDTRWHLPRTREGSVLPVADCLSSKMQLRRTRGSSFMIFMVATCHSLCAQRLWYYLLNSPPFSLFLFWFFPFAWRKTLRGSKLCPTAITQGCRCCSPNKRSLPWTTKRIFNSLLLFLRV